MVGGSLLSQRLDPVGRCKAVVHQTEHAGFDGIHQSGRHNEVTIDERQLDCNNCHDGVPLIVTPNLCRASLQPWRGRHNKLITNGRLGEA